MFEIEYSTYHILNRLELCECSLTAGNYLLSQTDINCRDVPEARDGYFTTYYAFNKIILDIITVKFDIQVDNRTITQSTLLHDDISGYNLLTLDFVLPPVNDEDLIALFLKKMIRECPSNNFRMSQSPNHNHDANLQCYIYVFF